jgi:thiamine-monophosphate kinase
MLNEENLISLFQKKSNDPNIIVGNGDDCFAWSSEANKTNLYTTDMLVEDVHFLKDKISASELARKALAVNLSDIASMGGKAKYFFLSIALPPDITDDWQKNFSSSLLNFASEYGVQLSGGDTVRSEKIIINIGVWGTVDPQNLRSRSNYAEGDLIYVVGSLGESLAGLELLQQGTQTSHPLIQKHHNPKPLCNEGEWLGAQSAVKAMMDISDGLKTDLEKLLKINNLGAEVRLENIQLTSDLLNNYTDKRQAIDTAWIGGEDYALLVLVDEKQRDSFEENFRKVYKELLQLIGKVTKGEIKTFLHGKNYKYNKTPFQHWPS